MVLNHPKTAKLNTASCCSESQPKKKNLRCYFIVIILLLLWMLMQISVFSSSLRWPKWVIRSPTKGHNPQIENHSPESWEAKGSRQVGEKEPSLNNLWWEIYFDSLWKGRHLLNTLNLAQWHPGTWSSWAICIWFMTQHWGNKLSLSKNSWTVDNLEHH